MKKEYLFVFISIFLMIIFQGAHAISEMKKRPLLDLISPLFIKEKKRKGKKKTDLHAGKNQQNIYYKQSPANTRTDSQDLATESLNQ